MSTQAEKSQSVVIPLRERQRLILTWDGGQPAAAPPEVAARQVRSLVQALEGSHVGIYQRHIGGTIRAAQPSKVLELDHPQQRRLEAGVDIMSVFVDECHKCGIQAWGSSRMNDAHHTYKGLNTDVYQTAFYKEHPELQLKEWDDSRQVSAQYDWNKPEVAKINLALLQEVAENYDVDGLDLDFTRSAPYFNPGEEAAGREVMNQHVRNVRALLDRVGEVKGKRLGLSAQFYHHDTICPHDAVGEVDLRRILEKAPDGITGYYEGGFDVASWVAEGLLDILMGQCRTAALFESDISAWHRVVEGTNCRLVVGPGKPSRRHTAKIGWIDGFHANSTNHWEHRAIAHRLYEQGADGISFYDYLFRNYEPHWEVFRELGDPERLRYANKTYVFQLALPLELGTPEQGPTEEVTMDIDIVDDITAVLAQGMPVGVRLLLNVTETDWARRDLVLTVNGQEVTVEWEAGLTLPLVVLDHPSDNLHCHRQAVIDPGLLKKGRNRLTFRILQSDIQPPAYLKPEPCEVRKVELEITYEDETLPYWLRAQLPR
jgi:hypothetical protein